MATLRQCKKCIHYNDCPILHSKYNKGAKGLKKTLKKNCISYKDKK